MTVFVTNDGQKYSAGFGDGDGAGVDDGGDADPSNDVGAYPARVGQGATFTYFDANAFLDAPKFVPASTSSDVDLALRGGPKAAARFFSSSDRVAERGVALGRLLLPLRARVDALLLGRVRRLRANKEYKVRNASALALEAALCQQPWRAYADGDPSNDAAPAKRSPCRASARAAASWFEMSSTAPAPISRPCAGGNTSRGVNTSTP